MNQISAQIPTSVSWLRAYNVLSFSLICLATLVLVFQNMGEYIVGGSPFPSILSLFFFITLFVILSKANSTGTAPLRWQIAYVCMVGILAFLLVLFLEDYNTGLNVVASFIIVGVFFLFPIILLSRSETRSNFRRYDRNPSRLVRIWIRVCVWIMAIPMMLFLVMLLLF